MVNGAIGAVVLAGLELGRADIVPDGNDVIGSAARDDEVFGVGVGDADCGQVRQSQIRRARACRSKEDDTLEHQVRGARRGKTGAASGGGIAS
jgi:hypothetical protein